MTVTPVRSGLFTEGATLGQEIHLLASRCPDCMRVEFPASSICANCGSATSVEPLPGQAELVGFTSVQYAPPGARVEVPYHVGVARFGSDLCVMGLIDGAGEELDFGLTVRTVAVALAADDGITYGFRPALPVSA